MQGIRSRGAISRKKRDQLLQSLRVVFHPELSHFATRFIDHNRVMVPISPVDASKPHIDVLSGQERPGTGVSLYLAGDSHPSNHRCEPPNTPGKLSLF